jgi:hypothetical protein
MATDVSEEVLQETNKKLVTSRVTFWFEDETMPSFETPVDFFRTTWRYFPENGILHMVQLPHIYNAFIYTMEH